MVCISFICLINGVIVQVNHFLQVDDTLCVIFKMTSGMEWKRDARAAEIDRRRMISSH